MEEESLVWETRMIVYLFLLYHSGAVSASTITLWASVSTSVKETASSTCLIMGIQCLAPWEYVFTLTFRAVQPGQCIHSLPYTVAVEPRAQMSCGIQTEWLRSLLLWPDFLACFLGWLVQAAGCRVQPWRILSDLYS